jgi:hypothetical protein
LDEELDRSLVTVERAFDIFEGRSIDERGGSFAFVVPPRIRRELDQCGDEAFDTLPLLRHVDAGTRQWAIAGCCPMVLDRYGVDQHGTRGVMLVAPVFADIFGDVLGLSCQVGLVRAIVRATVQMAVDRFGARTVGLGATLPRLTDYGRSVAEPGVRTTTGHAGTVWLLLETLRQARQLCPSNGPIGIVGAGAIGLAAAQSVLAGDPFSEIALYDVDRSRLRFAERRLCDSSDAARVTISTDLPQLLGTCPVTVAAATTPISLAVAEYDELDLGGKVIVDDSQPPVFQRSEVESHGGRLVWVIGRDGSGSGVVTRSAGFRYGGCGPVSNDEVWGCEAEAAALAVCGRDQPGICGPVTIEDTGRIGSLCRQLGIRTAPLQSFGAYV